MHDSDGAITGCHEPGSQNLAFIKSFKLERHIDATAELHVSAIEHERLGLFSERSSITCWEQEVRAGRRCVLEGPLPWVERWLWFCWVSCCSGKRPPLLQASLPLPSWLLLLPVALPAFLSSVMHALNKGSALFFKISKHCEKLMLMNLVSRKQISYSSEMSSLEQLKRFGFNFCCSSKQKHCARPVWGFFKYRSR